MAVANIAVTKLQVQFFFCLSSMFNSSGLYANPPLKDHYLWSGTSTVPQRAEPGSFAPHLLSTGPLGPALHKSRKNHSLALTVVGFITFSQPLKGKVAHSTKLPQGLVGAPTAGVPGFSLLESLTSL